MGAREDKRGGGPLPPEGGAAGPRTRPSESALWEAETDLYRTGGAAPAQDTRDLVITVISGPQAGLSRVLEKEVVVGRSPECDIMIEDTTLSRRHCRFVRQGDAVLVEDLGSSNGTYLAGARLAQAARAAEGDRVQVGRSLLGLSRQDRLEQQAHRQLYESSMCDPLTGLSNRRYFEHRLREEFAHALRQHTPLLLLILDVDDWKKVVATWGQDAGDTVLKSIAPVLRRNLRLDDVAARLHAEQFAILARVTPGGDERALGERVRQQIAELRVPHEAETITITASVGVAVLPVVSSDESPIALIAAADRALYKAKRAGGNRCEQP